MNMDWLMKRRTEELHSRTRSEIVMSLGAALFLVAVVGWRFASVQQRLPMIGFVAAIAWVLISWYRLRDRIRREGPGRGEDALAATGMEHYRKELELRRDHLRNAWLWHGPLFLACLTLMAILTGKASPGFDRLRNALPLVIVLALWTGFGFWRRRRQAREIQREIDALEPPSVRE